MVAELRLRETLNVPSPVSCCAFGPSCLFLIGSGELNTDHPESILAHISSQKMDHVVCFDYLARRLLKPSTD